MTLWEAALGGAAGGGGNDALGECYDDSAFDEIFDIDNTTPDNIMLSVASGERHDGTAGTGARIVRTGGGNVVTIGTSAIVEWLEVDVNDEAPTNAAVSDDAPDDTVTVRNMLIHDMINASNLWGIEFTDFGVNSNFYCLNNILYAITSNNEFGGTLYGIADFSGGGPDSVLIQNCVVQNVVKTSSGSPTGNVNSFFVGNAATRGIKNCIAGTLDGGATSGNTDNYNVGALADEDYNMASDDSDAGANSIGADDGVVISDEFVSTAGGSEDLHLKSGADAIDAGVDLGIANGVNIDIDGRDRDAEGDTWDMGAHEFVAVGGSPSPRAGIFGPLRGPLRGPV